MVHSSHGHRGPTLRQCGLHMSAGSAAGRPPAPRLGRICRVAFRYPAVVVFSSARLGRLAGLDNGHVRALQATWRMPCAPSWLRSDTYSGFGCLRNWLDLIFLETVLQVGWRCGRALVRQRAIPRVTTSTRQPDGLRISPSVPSKYSRSVARSTISRPGRARRHSGERRTPAKILIGLGNMQARQLGTRPVILILPTHDERSTSRPDAGSSPASTWKDARWCRFPWNRTSPGRATLAGGPRDAQWLSNTASDSRHAAACDGLVVRRRERIQPPARSSADRICAGVPGQGLRAGASVTRPASQHATPGEMACSSPLSESPMPGPLLWISPT